MRYDPKYTSQSEYPPHASNSTNFGLSLQEKEEYAQED